jgi:tetratricopeptide (TPR) repeat protein
MLRESLERIAREADNWQRYNLICAGIVSEQGVAGSEARIGHYLLAAGELQRALDLLTSAARATDLRGDPRKTRFLLGKREVTLDLLQVPDDDPRRLEGWLLWANSGRAEGRLKEALEWAKQVIEAAKRPGLEAMRAEALLISARIARFHGELARSWRRSREGERIARPLGHKRLLGKITREQAWVLSTRGDHDRARERFRDAIAYFAAADDEINLATSLNGLAISEVQSARYQDARRHAQRALEIHRRLGSRTFAAMTLNTLGDIERIDGGSLDIAEAHYRFSVRSLTAAGLGSGYLGCAHMHVGLVLMARECFAEAEDCFESALGQIEGQGVPQFLAMIRVMMLPCVAARKDFDSFASYLDQAEETLSGMFEVDVADPARVAGEMASEAGMRELALRAFRFSLRQWEGLGRQAEARDTREQILKLQCSSEPQRQRQIPLP